MKLLLLKLLAKFTVSGTVILNNTCKCKWGGQKGFVVECLNLHRPTSNKDKKC
jgi:hypothetical protein